MKEKICEKNSVALVEEDAADIWSIITDVSPVVEKKFAPDAPEKIFWEQQTKLIV